MRDLIFLYIGYGFIISEHPKTLISTWIASVVIYVILILYSVVSVDCNSFAYVRLPPVQCSLILGILDWGKLRMLWVYIFIGTTLKSF